MLISFKNARLLVIAPHADDEVLGCGGLISKIKSVGGKVFVLIFNVGSIEKYNNKKFTDLRKKEAAAAMKFLKVDRYDTIFDSPNDNRYLDAKPLHELISKIETESKVSLTKIKPTIVPNKPNFSIISETNKPIFNCLLSLSAKSCNKIC